MSWSSGSFIRKVSSIFRPKPSLKRQINEILYRLEVQRDKLNECIMRLQNRDKELFEKTIAAYMSKDMARAAIYASEVSELRKIIKVVYASQLALERIMIRLETVRDLGDVATVIAPVIPVLKELKNQLAGIIPEIAVELGEISNTMNNMLLEIGQATDATLSVNVLDEGAKKVLAEAQAIAEERLRKEFPQLPSEIPIEERRVEPVACLVGASSASGREELQAPSRNMSLEEVEERLLSYVKLHNGLLDVDAFSRETGIPREDVFKALDSLRAKGVIKTLA